MRAVNHFAERRGTWYIEDPGVVVLFNNHPYEERYASLRDEELAVFRRELVGKGIRERGYATYPEDGYSYAIVLEAGPGRAPDEAHGGYLPEGLEPDPHGFGCRPRIA